MLTKTARTVVIAGQPAAAYRPYSRTCPPPVPPHVKRWVTKTLCGTATHYLLLQGNQVVGYLHNYLINYNGQVVMDQNVVDLVVPAADSWSTQLAYTESFCTKVRVYE